LEASLSCLISSNKSKPPHKAEFTSTHLESTKAPDIITMAEPAKVVDRKKTTPFLLKLFYRAGSFHTPEHFNPSNAHLPQHVQVYTWSSCTLRELSSLLTTAVPLLLPSPAAGTRLCFRLFYADARDGGRGRGYGRYLSRDIGNVIVGGRPERLFHEEDGNGPEKDDKEKEKEKTKVIFEGDADATLAEVNFMIGDYVSCVVLPPSVEGEVAAPPRPVMMQPMRHGPAGGRTASGRTGRFNGVPSGEWRRGEVPGSEAWGR
jgi:histone deacetylase complex subunit SAP18